MLNYNHFNINSVSKHPNVTNKIRNISDFCKKVEILTELDKKTRKTEKDYRRQNLSTSLRMKEGVKEIFP